VSTATRSAATVYTYHSAKIASLVWIARTSWRLDVTPKYRTSRNRGGGGVGAECAAVHFPAEPDSELHGPATAAAVNNLPRGTRVRELHDCRARESRR
jgi:hypothetical protein